MPAEPETKRVVAFIDGQNLFRTVKNEWQEYHFPNYDIIKLTRAVGELKAADGWNAPTVRFYTGTPLPMQDAMWSGFWQRKIANNRERDCRAKKQLHKDGWKVLTVWECETKDEIGLPKKLTDFLERVRIDSRGRAVAV